MKWSKEAAAFLFVLALLFLGNQGRQLAATRAALDGICEFRDQLQAKVATAEDLAEQRPSRPEAGVMDLSLRMLDNAGTRSLADKLRTELDQFSSSHSPAGLSMADNLEFRLCQATLANAERRFGDALSIIKDQDSRHDVAGSRERTLAVRADAFFGLGDSKAALDCYRQVLTLQPERVAAKKRLGECQYKLGEFDQASATFEQVLKLCNEEGDASLRLGRPDAAGHEYETGLALERWVGPAASWKRVEELLALTHNQLGNALLILGKSEAAQAEYEKALIAETKLGEQPNHKDLTTALALTHYSSGNAFFAGEAPDRAATEYQKVIEILTGSQEGSKMKVALATAYKGAGDAHFAQGKPDAAAEDYARAIGLFEMERRPELTPELGMSYNNRGVARRAIGDPAGALADFQSAVNMLTQATSASAQKGTVGNAFAPLGLAAAQVQLDVTFKHANHGTEVLTRTRVVGQSAQNEEAIVLATSLENRGYARRLQGNLEGAVKDFHQAAEVFANLVDQEGERSLNGEFAKSLTALAWFYATTPNPAFQDAAQAKQYALKACVLSDWKAPDAMDALAAACAGCAEFNDAVKWQQKATELVAGKRKTELMTRLQLYRAGRPYHEPK